MYKTTCENNARKNEVCKICGKIYRLIFIYSNINGSSKH